MDGFCYDFCDVVVYVGDFVVFYNIWMFVGKCGIMFVVFWFY